VRRDLCEVWNAPPAPAFPSIVHGAFTLNDDSIGSLFTLWQKSKLLRVAVIDEQDANTAALFAGQLKDPSSVVIRREGMARGKRAGAHRAARNRAPAAPTFLLLSQRGAASRRTAVRWCCAARRRIILLCRFRAHVSIIDR
jgi:hypothetical protein